MKSLHSYFIEEALHDYEVACEELNRPEHDVVTHSVCHLTRKSICSLLQAYLYSKNIQVSENESMEKLVNKSISANPSLLKFDFSILACGHLPLQDNPANYCIHEESVKHCYSLLGSLKNYLFEDMKMNRINLE